ncbi:MAG: hypothetical protein CMG66_03235 [Candidatus Marinimicrobia bacterium]|nr:hypothetical protein [Candidatus Neomarinimicrobiota bacterium]|tara:strand:- start:48174 stop:49079 length:906 start_codon:yes stop_codon:yes gene_type:complete
MINFFIILIIYICNSIICSDTLTKKEFPKLDLRNFNGTINNLGIGSIDNLLPDRSKENDVLLLEHQIEAIKLAAKQFIPKPISNDDVIMLSTNLGLMKFKFYNKESPISSLNFKKLSNSKFYDKTLFHYVVPKFIIQGGDILSRNQNPDDDGQGGPGWVIDSDYNQLKHSRGTLSMVRMPNDVNSAGSQFFISLDSNSELDNKYVVFGYLIDGDHILSRIAKVSSEYKQAKLLCKTNVPEIENIEDWVKLYDPVLKENIYSKVPDSEDKNIYKEALQNKLNNIFKPGVPVIVDSIRIVKEN